MSDIFRTDIMPTAVTRLREDRRGYPVPWFVAWFDDEPDFRVMDTVKWDRAWRERLCWVCGTRLPRESAYVIGPMCAVNRIASEPTSHVNCAQYAAQACPFLAEPKRTRKDHKPLPEDTRDPAGMGIMRNPGVALVWVVSGRIKPFRVDTRIPGAQAGHLFNIGTPTRVEWYAHGRTATRQEVADAIESGMPTLLDKAVGTQAKVALSAAKSQVMNRLLPAA